MKFSSTLIERAVNEFSRLPGIGKKTALRLVLHLLKQPEDDALRFGEAIQTMRKEVQFCKQCHNVADTPLCNICNDAHRKQQVVCVVESIRDVMAIESTQQFTGTYHVLGGILSPLDGIGPEQLHIESLVQRIAQQHIEELILAISPTLEGDTTLFYISKKVAPYGVKLTTLSRGVAFGGELEYADELTLARSLQNRQPLDQLLKTH